MLWDHHPHHHWDWLTAGVERDKENSQRKREERLYFWNVHVHVERN